MRHTSSTSACHLDDSIHERDFVSGEASYHGFHELLLIDPVLDHLMPCNLHENIKQSELATTIALPERMDGIDIGDVVSRTRSEVLNTVRVGQMVLSAEFAKNPVHLSVDVLWIAEPISALGGANLPCLSRPPVDVLKKMVMNCPVMGIVERTFGQRFLGPSQEHQLLELIKLILICQVWLIP